MLPAGCQAPPNSHTPRHPGSVPVPDEQCDPGGSTGAGGGGAPPHPCVLMPPPSQAGRPPVLHGCPRVKCPNKGISPRFQNLPLSHAACSQGNPKKGGSPPKGPSRCPPALQIWPQLGAAITASEEPWHSSVWPQGAQLGVTAWLWGAWFWTSNSGWVPNLGCPGGLRVPNFGVRCPFGFFWVSQLWCPHGRALGAARAAPEGSCIQTTPVPPSQDPGVQQGCSGCGSWGVTVPPALSPRRTEALGELYC